MAYPNIDFLYLSEKDMLAAGVDDVLACTDCMEEVLKLLDLGDYRMGGEAPTPMAAWSSSPTTPNSPKCPRTARTDASWPCPPIWAASLTWPA